MTITLVGWGRKPRNRSDKPYASIGDNHVDEAVRKLHQLQQRAMTVMVQYAPTREETIEMLFTKDVIDRARLAKNIIQPMSDRLSYDVATDATLMIDYTDCAIPAISPFNKMPQPDKISPLTTFIAEARKVHEQYEDVKQMLRWFNRYATPAAVRYYWPPILTLCPNAPNFTNLQDVPTRHTTPKDVSSVMQLIRDTATTMAGSAMLSKDIKPRERKHLVLTFTHEQVSRGDHRYMTDNVAYNL